MKISYLLPLTSALMLACSLPFIQVNTFGFLTFFGLVPLFIFLLSTESAVSKKEKVLVSLFVGIVYFFAVLSPLLALESWWWLSPESFLYDYRNVIFTLLIFLVAVYGGTLIFLPLSILFIKLNTSKCNKLLILFVPILYVVLESVKTFSVSGFGWGTLAYNLSPDSVFSQVVSVVGVSGLSFIIVLVNILFAFSLVKNNKIFLVPFVILIAMFTFGKVMENKTLPPLDISIAVMNSKNLSDSDLSFSSSKNEFARIVTFMQESGLAGKQVAILPENIFPAFVLNEQTLLPIAYENNGSIKEYYDKLMLVSRTYPDTSYVFGMHTFSEINKEKYNSLLVIENGQVKDIYSKRVVLPFTESREFTNSNKNKDSIITQYGEFGALLCSEMADLRLFPKNRELVIIAAHSKVFNNDRAKIFNHQIAKINALAYGSSLIISEKNSE
jgi:apolipoprotein N-acyltransferase